MDLYRTEKAVGRGEGTRRGPGTRPAVSGAVELCAPEGSSPNAWDGVDARMLAMAGNRRGPPNPKPHLFCQSSRHGGPA